MPALLVLWHALVHAYACLNCNCMRTTGVCVCEYLYTRILMYMHSHTQPLARNTRTLPTPRTHTHRSPHSLFRSLPLCATGREQLDVNVFLKQAHLFKEEGVREQPRNTLRTYHTLNESCM
jgi:hypothetical protein